MVVFSANGRKRNKWPRDVSVWCHNFVRATDAANDDDDQNGAAELIKPN